MYVILYVCMYVCMYRDRQIYTRYIYVHIDVECFPFNYMAQKNISNGPIFTLRIIRNAINLCNIISPHRDIQKHEVSWIQPFLHLLPSQQLQKHQPEGCKLQNN